jgi:UDP-N-acetyl-alpha-D-muramoyl-L-alanyl-L-glutamate epimerase
MQNYSSDSRKFIYETYRFDIENLQAHFYYSLLDINNPENTQWFEEVINFDDGNFDLREDLNFEILENLLFHLHLALWISYYKLYPTEKLIIKSGSIDNSWIEFWEKFYKNGLWEFLYRNNINPENLFQFEINCSNKIEKINFLTSNKALIPVWWWKDSIVSLELFRKSGIDFDTFVFWKIDPIKQKCIDTTGKTNFLVTRKLSQRLFELNETWEYFNGHVPITWIIAFSMEVVAYLFDYKYLILSNELSANFGNTQWKWIEINHQWSKSLEFERDFWEYVEKYISSDVKYFSLLRWMYEIKIAELFSNLWKKYFENFSSCNNNFKIHKEVSHNWLWCNDCPKCAFVFSMLHPYLDTLEILQIFWQDLYTDNKLEKLFEELLWISGIKPFECVWTNEEVVYAMWMSYSKIEDKTALPYILQIFENKILPNFLEPEQIKLKEKLFKTYNEDIIPVELKKILD